MKKSKKLAYLSLFVSLFLISSLSLPLNQVFADQMQDNEDLEVTLHGEMNVDSAELVSSLMPTGAYNFFEKPELNIKDSEIDLFRAELSEIQQADSNSTDYNHSQILRFVNSTEGNKTVINEIPEYNVGAGIDSILMGVINFSGSVHNNDTIIYQDNFTNTDWELVGTDNIMRTTPTRISTDDVYIDEHFGSSTFDSTSVLEFGENPFENTDKRALLQLPESDYLVEDDDYMELKLYFHAVNERCFTYLWSVDDYNPSSVTYDNYGSKSSTRDNIVDVTAGKIADNNWYTFTIPAWDSGGEKSFEIGDDDTISDTNAFYSADTTSSNYPRYIQYLSKFHQDQADGLIYFQTNESETLKMRGPQFEDKSIYPNNYITLDIQSNSDTQINITLRNDGSKVKSFEVLPAGNSDTSRHDVNVSIDEKIDFDQFEFSSSSDLDAKDFFKVYNISVFSNFHSEAFANAHLNNLTYKVKGLTYHQNITLDFDNTNSKYDWNNGTYVFYTSTADLNDRSLTEDLTIINQNLTTLLDFSKSVENLNYSIRYNFTQNVYKVPSEIGMKLNEEDIIDESINSGYVSFTSFQDDLNFEASQKVYFKLNITVSFRFRFDLDVISHTYLRKKFKLLNDHNIEFTQIDISNNLNIKKVYLNNINYGNSLPIYITPAVSMSPNQIYALEVILADDLYLPLSHIYNNLGSGNSQLLLTGSTNTLQFNNVNQYNNVDIDLLANYQAQAMNLTFSDIDYTPAYTSNNSNNLYSSGGGSSSWDQENVDYKQDYYQTETNGYKVGESGGSGYEQIYNQEFNSEPADATHDYFPDNYDSSYNYDNNEMFLDNRFPNDKFQEGLFTEREGYYLLGSFIDSASYGITSNGTSFFVTGYDGKIRQFSTDFSTLENTYDIGALGGNDDPFCISYENNNFFVIDSDDNVYQYSTDFSTLEDTHNIGALGGNDNPYGITSNGTSFFITDNDGFVYQYSTDFSTLENSYDLSALGTIDRIQGITYVFNSFFVVDHDTLEVYQYSTDFSTLEDTHDIDALVGIEWASGIVMDKRNFYVIDPGQKVVFKYDSDFWQVSDDLPSGNTSITPSTSNLTLTNGALNSTGDLSSIDDDYTSFNSTEAGHYPATYSFEDDADGSNPSGWTMDEGGGTAQIISEKDGHNKVVELDDTNGSDGTEIMDTISAPTTGTIEFWYKTDDNTKRTNWQIEDENWANSITLQIEGRGSNNIRYYDDSWHNIGTLDDTDWHHIRIDFDTSDDWHLWIDGVSIDGGSGYTYDGTPTNFDLFTIKSDNMDANYKIYIDAIGYSWDSDYNVGDNLEMLPPELNATYTTQIGTQYDTIEYLNLLYSHKTDISQEINMSVWNWNTNNWLLVNSSVNNQSFFSMNKDDFSSLTDILNSSNYLKINFYGLNISTEFQLYIDQLKFEYNYTTTGGNVYTSISKSIDYSFLNRYDSDADYQKLYNITCEFQYKFTNTSKYTNFTQFTIDSNEHTLTDSGNWESFSFNFEFDSSSADAFNILFNVSNGLLEIKNMNYTIKFKCLDTSNRVALGQYYSFDLPISLDYLQQTRGNFILNYSINFNATEDTFYNFYNQVNNSYLNIRIAAYHEDGADYIYYYNTNSSFEQDFSINITDYFNSLGKSNLKDLVFKIAMCGNPSNLSLDNMTLFDYDSDFYQVDFVNISDSLVISRQNITLSWKSSDRYISNVEIEQQYKNEAVAMIYNITLQNNTMQSRTLNNNSAGAYYLNLTFYDDYDNWEKWSLNYTIIGITGISTSYQNPVFVQNNNTVSARIESEYSITHIYYDNSSEYTQEYANSSFPTYSYEFNFTINYSIETNYNISIKVLTEYNDSFWVNITALSFIKRATSLNLDGLKTHYEQDDTLTMTITLADTFNNLLNNENINYTLVAPNNTAILDTSATTNTTGEIMLNINFNLGYDPGFYHLNFSFESTNAYHYCYKLDSFEITPISRSVNSSEINLQVNNHNVSSNFIQINHTSDLNITHLDNATFDLSAVLLLNYTENITYIEYFSYSFTFQPSTDVTYFDIASANITNVPVNFTNYYYNDLATSNYNLTNNNLQINDLLGNILQDESSFKVALGYLEDQRHRTQITEQPTTNDETIEFSEIMSANRSFSYWYFENELDINSITLEHIRTSDTISSFDINNSKYYFEKTCQEDDLFNATIDYNPNWDIDYTIEINNGTYSMIKIDYSADLSISNVDLILDLSNNSLYNENWTMSATQNKNNFKLTIPNINFSNSEQSIYIEGFSSVPYASITEFESDQNWNRIAVDSDPIDYAGFLGYPKFSKIFYTTKEPDWNVYNVHYGNEKYNAESLSDRLAKFEGDGFDPGVTDSYIHFRTNPFKKVDWDWDEDTDNITITINSSLAVEKAYFQIQFNPSQAHELELISNTTSIFGLSDSGDYEGYLFFYVNELPEGETVIKIHINYTEPLEILLQGLPIFLIAAALIGVYYYLKKHEERVEKAGKYIDDKLLSKLRSEEADWEEVQQFRIKNNKIQAKTEKK
ncbi:MAG: hypothetical protein KGY74_07090 [Candidatus Cloacimonetes bacterium]|nr:hypothetical protein [Candidatus Cloacimonadota bacterium]